MARDGDALFDHYRHTLEELGKQPGTLALIFGKAQNKFQDPAKLRRVIVDLIDAEDWSSMGADVKGDAYEGLLEKNAQDTKSGAGQYFTPRALILGVVDCIAPKPGELICDPACGTGGFLFTAHQYLTQHNTNLTRDEKRHLKEGAFRGWELVQATARVCAMNLMLHGIGSEKSVPCLPTGLFYAQGVKANVIFFDKKPASETPWTRKLWIYDLRTNKHFTLTTNPLKRADLDEFVALYHPANRHQRQATWSAEKPDGRWRVYEYDELVARDKASLDIFWLKDESLADSDNLPPPEVIAQEIVDDLEAALEQFRLLAADLNGAETTGVG